MRRSRSALTAWPAFADLMTVLAVLGLAIAAGVASVNAPGDETSPIGALKAELAAAQERNARDGDRIRALKAELAAARELVETLEADILGSVPCLGTRPGSRTAPVRLLRIVVDAGYRLTRPWPPEANVADIPRLEEAIAHGLMQEGDFRSYARGMHAYGNDENNYRRPCRFWVEFQKGETTSQAAFARALGIVNQYFLLSNSSEVNRILAGTE